MLVVKDHGSKKRGGGMMSISPTNLRFVNKRCLEVNVAKDSALFKQHLFVLRFYIFIWRIF